MRKGKGIDGIEGKRKRRSEWVERRSGWVVREKEGEGEKPWKKVGAFRICWVDKLRPN